MAKEKKTIDLIKYGEMHLYYPIQFDAAMDYRKLCKNIETSCVVFNETHSKMVKNEMMQHACKTREILSEIECIKSSTINMVNVSTKEKIDTSTCIPNNKEAEDDYVKSDVYISQGDLQIYYTDIGLEALEIRYNQLEIENKNSQKHYGEAFIQKYEKFILIPFYATLYNGKKVWIHAILSVFTNKMGILKLEIPLNEIDISPLKKWDIDDLISSFLNRWNPEKDSITSLHGLCQYYINGIINKPQDYAIRYDAMIKNIILLDFKHIPTQVDSLSNDICEELYRIVCAPVPNFPFSSYSSIAQEYVKTHDYNMNGVKYIAKSNGGLLSLVSKKRLDFTSDNYKHLAGIETLSPDDYDVMCNKLALGISNDVEFAIFIILMKKLNELNDFHNKIFTKKEFYLARKEYNQNIIYINDLYKTCYGSVFEQTSKLISMMPLYVKEEINLSNQIAIDTILADYKQKQSEIFLNFMSVGGLLITIVLGLPALKQTVAMLRSTILWLVPNDIPYISVDNISIFLWAILNIFFVFKLVNIRR